MRPHLRFQSLQWLFPIAATAHNLEEGIWLPGFVSTHQSQWSLVVDGGRFRVALVALTAAAWIIAYFSWRCGPQTIWAYLLFGYAVAMLVNVVAPHVPAAVLFRGYVPGLVTAVLVNLPVMSLLLIRAVKERIVSGRKAVAFAVSVPVTLAAMILFLFWL